MSVYKWCEMQIQLQVFSVKFRDYKGLIRSVIIHFQTKSVENAPFQVSPCLHQGPILLSRIYLYHSMDE